MGYVQEISEVFSLIVYSTMLFVLCVHGELDKNANKLWKRENRTMHFSSSLHISDLKKSEIFSREMLYSCYDLHRLIDSQALINCNY